MATDIFITTNGRGYLVAEINGKKISETEGLECCGTIGYGHVISTDEEFSDGWEVVDFLEEYAEGLAD